MALKRDDTSWFPRFGDISGLTWTTPPGVDRHKIRGEDVRPERKDWDSDSVRWRSLEPGEDEGRKRASEPRTIAAWPHPVKSSSIAS